MNADCRVTVVWVKKHMVWGCNHLFLQMMDWDTRWLWLVAHHNVGKVHTASPLIVITFLNVGFNSIIFCFLLSVWKHCCSPLHGASLWGFWEPEPHGGSFSTQGTAPTGNMQDTFTLAYLGTVTMWLFTRKMVPESRGVALGSSTWYEGGCRRRRKHRSVLKGLH